MKPWLTKEEHEKIRKMYEELRERLPPFLRGLEYETIAVGEAQIHKNGKVYVYLQLKGYIKRKTYTIASFAERKVDEKELFDLVYFYRAVKSLQKAFHYLQREGVLKQESSD